MNNVPLISLQFYAPRFLEELSHFTLPEEQIRFTALPRDMVEQSEERHPIMILLEDEPVGFFVLHSSSRVQEYTVNPNAML
jgi:hypothetical protein